MLSVVLNNITLLLYIVRIGMCVTTIDSTPRDARNYYRQNASGCMHGVLGAVLY